MTLAAPFMPFRPFVPFFPIRALVLSPARMGHQWARMKKSVACDELRGYRSSVAANSATGRRNPNLRRRTGAPFRLLALFLCSQSRVMAAVCGQASAWPGSFFPGIPTPCTAATQSRRKDRGSSSAKEGATPMNALIPSKIRALAHRRMALSALRARSSLSVRLKRYNHHMDQARALEAQGGVQ
ncbi:ash family protein [Pseudomonas sp. BIOMIG1BAC]|nr:ash family protein [Pseudomonas sp. BIOMIG1BAC]